MDKSKTPYLCGGVLFFLLTQASLPDGTARDHKAGKKDEHSEPILMRDLIYTFTGSQNYGAQKDTSKYKDCESEGSINIPFNDIAKCTSYDNTVRENYSVALSRMDEFVDWHFETDMKGWFVKAILEIIENDAAIDESEQFFILEEGQPVTKGEIRLKENYDLSAFLVGTLHFIATKRREKNNLGVPTLETIGEKKARKPRRYTGNLGEAITRAIKVSFLPVREKPDEADANNEESLETVIEQVNPSVLEVSDDQTDDEVINGSLLRTGEALASVFGSISTPKINTEGMTGAIATVAAVAKAVTPDDQQKENLMQGAAAIANAFKSQRHSWAEQIRQSQRQEKAASESETTEDEKTAPEEDPGQEGQKTTIIQQQTNVIQNGDNNINVTNNGTMNFNF